MSYRYLCTRHRGVVVCETKYIGRYAQFSQAAAFLHLASFVEAKRVAVWIGVFGLPQDLVTSFN